MVCESGVRVREEIPPRSSDRRNVDARNSRNAFGRGQVSRGERHRSERIVYTGMKCCRNPEIRKAS